MITENIRRIKLAAFFLRGKPRTAGKGDIVIYPEDTPPGVFFIKSGYVKVYSINPDGLKKIIMIYKPGEAFPMVWTFSGTALHAYFEAMSDAEFYLAPREDLLRFIEEDPRMATYVLRRVTRGISTYEQRIDVLQQSTAYLRIVHHICWLAERLGKKQQKGILIPVPMTHQDTADATGTTRETASRQLKKLSENGFITYKKQRIKIHDLEKLAAELE